MNEQVTVVKTGAKWAKVKIMFVKLGNAIMFNDYE